MATQPGTAWRALPTTQRKIEDAMPNKQLARGLWTEFANTEDPFGIPNGMHANLRTVDDLIGIYTLLEPQPADAAYPPNPTEGEGQIYTDGSFAVFNAGSWQRYTPRPGVKAIMADGSDVFLSTSDSSWLSMQTFDPGFVGAVKRSFQSKFKDAPISAADAGAVGDGIVNDGEKFSALELNVSGEHVDLLGKTYLVDTIPNGNDYFNGAFLKDGSFYWKPQNPRAHPFESPVATIRAVLPHEGVYRGLNVGIVQIEGVSTWKLIWREATGHGVENGTVIMAADTVDAGKTLTNLRVIYRVSAADTRNFVSGRLGNGRIGIVAARPQEAGTYLPPVFIYSDNPGQANEAWTAITLPATASVDFHGAIYQYPTAVGGHDTLGWIAYGYRPTAEGGGITAFTTVDNGATWTEHLALILPTGGFPSLSEISVARIGNELKWVATIRSSANLNVAISISTDMLTWSVPANSGLMMGSNPPSVFYEDGKLWLLSFSRTGAGREIIPEYGNAIVISEGSPKAIWSANGTGGWRGWKVISTATFWPTGYISLARVRGRWYGLFTLAEEQAGNSRGRTAYLGMLSCDAVDSSNARQMKATIPQENSCWNGGMQLWQAGPSINSFPERTMVADGFTFARSGFVPGAIVSRENGTKGRYAMRIRRVDGDTSAAAMNLTFALTMDESIPYRDEVVTVQLRVTAASGFSAANKFLGVQLRQTSFASEQQIVNSSGLFTNGDMPVDSSSTGVTVDGISRDFVLTVQNVAKDTNQLLLRITWTPVGAALNDYIDIECVKIEPGRLATPFVFLSEYEVLNRAQRFYQSKTVRTENGSRNIGLIKMHRTPTISVDVGTASNITRDGFELSHNASANCLIVASSIL